MKKLTWAIWISIFTGVFSIIVGNILAALSAITLFIIAIVIAKCGKGDEPRRWIKNTLLLLSIIILLSSVISAVIKINAYGKLRINPEEKMIQEVAEKEELTKTLEISTNDFILEPEDKGMVTLKIESEGIAITSLTNCDWKTIGGEVKQITNQETSTGATSILEVVKSEQGDLEIWLSKDGIESNHLTIIVKDFEETSEEVDEEQQTTEPQKEEPKVEVQQVAPKIVTQTKIKEVPVVKEVVKEIVKEVPVIKEVVKEVPAAKPATKPIVKEEKVQTTVTTPTYNYNYTGDPADGAYSGNYNYNNGYSNYYYGNYTGDPSGNYNSYNNSYGNSYNNITIEGSRYVHMGETYTYTIKGVSNFQVSNLELGDMGEYVTVKKKSNNSFSIYYEEGITGVLYLSYYGWNSSMVVTISE